MNQKEKVSPHVCGMLKEYHVLTQRIGKFNCYLNNCPSTKELHEQELQLAAMRLYAYHLAKRIELNGTDPEKTDANELFRHERYDSLRSADTKMAHYSEVAYWKKTPGKEPEEVLSNIDGGIPLEPDTVEIMESSGRSAAGFFPDMYRRAKDPRLASLWRAISAVKKLYEESEQKPNPYSGTSFDYNGHTWGMCARDNGVDILCDKHIIGHFEKQGEKPSEEQEAPAITSCPGIKFRVGDTVVCHDEKDRYFGTKNRIAAVYPEHGVYVCEDFQVILIQDQESYGLWEPGPSADDDNINNN